MQNENHTQIIGTVENIIYENSQNGYMVISVETDDELVVAVGLLSGICVGEDVVLTGSFVSHKSFGHQFKVDMFERKLPATSTAILKYLSSGIIKGIGAKTAKSIVDKFGDDSLEIIENNPKELATVNGISANKAAKLEQEFKKLFGIRAVMLFLAKFNIPPSKCVVIWKKWGILAIDVIKNNPYCLCETAINIAFDLVDGVALDLNISPTSKQRLIAGINYVLYTNLWAGHTCLPTQKLLDAATNLLEVDFDSVEIAFYDGVDEGTFYEIKKNKLFAYSCDMYVAETYISQRMSLMSMMKDNRNVDLDIMITSVEKNCGIVFEDIQRSAIKTAVNSGVLILTGGPGTGKTTTLNGIISVFDELGLKICISAPTGRASKRISEITGFDAKTIHRLLEVEFTENDRSKFKRNEDNPLDFDVVIIDEMSMVDTLLFDALLRAIKPSTKLILVGDSDQLPSVGAGNILKDLIDCGKIDTIRLQKIFRQASKSLIVTNAHSIVSGDMPDLTSKNSDFFFLKRFSSIDTVNTIVDLVCSRLPSAYKYSSFDDIQVLCPSRKGDLGSIELNKILQDKLNPSKNKNQEISNSLFTFRQGDKVMQIKNNYDIEWIKDEEKGVGIFNGDMGIVKLIDKASGCMMIDFDSRIVNYHVDSLSELELAYAITIHKSQGSEFNAVVIPILGGYEKLFFRNLLYTAVTRARQHLIIVGSEERIEFMVNNNRKTLRYTGLSHFIRNSSTN
jgi:exodeoxyribonuclease V alpha subunit